LQQKVENKNEKGDTSNPKVVEALVPGSIAEVRLREGWYNQTQLRKPLT
jgi:hypothetical protein